MSERGLVPCGCGLLSGRPFTWYTAMSLFSSSEEAVMTREIESSADSSLAADMDIAGTVEHIIRGGFKRVALQFPDEELGHAEAVLHLLQKELKEREARAAISTPAELFVLADTSFDGFQIDFVAAQHINADLVVHYGDADLEAEGPLASRFVFGRRPVSATALAASLRDQFTPDQRVLVVPALAYAHVATELLALLSPTHGMVTVAFADVEREATPESAPPAVAALPTATATANFTDAVAVEQLQAAAVDSGGWRLLGRRLSSALEHETLSSDATALVYVGAEDLLLSSLCVLLPRAAAYVYEPSGDAAAEGAGTDAAAVGAAAVGAAAVGAAAVEAAAVEAAAVEAAGGAEGAQGATAGCLRRLELQTAKQLMRRYYLVQQAREAQIVGILVGTLSAAGRKSMLAALKGLCRRAGRKHYVFVMGKLNEAKLANFLEVSGDVLLVSHTVTHGHARAHTVAYGYTWSHTVAYGHTRSHTVTRSRIRLVW